MKRLELPQELAQQIADIAATALPQECCGLIEGVWLGDAARAIGLHPARNLAGAARFEIAPEDHLAAQKAARANGHALIGCYHSHPGVPPHPSATDIAGATQDDFIWLIAGQVPPGGWDLAAFLAEGGAFAPLYLVMSSE